MTFSLIQKISLLAQLRQAVQLGVNQIHVPLDIRIAPFLARRDPVTQICEGSADVNLVGVDVLALDAGHELGGDQGGAAEALDGLADDVEAVFCNGMSKVYATDIYQTMFAADPLNVERARKYRQMVLEPGAGRPVADILEAYLGRESNSDAYYKVLADLCFFSSEA
ncbi:hypothetical protein B0T16DRAFT_497718 [Cercophora newfieldiana]|uniref:Peptidase M3A/M3B catalytic domain-containing protein n=1 Tax=Cercophora newfieldiana TaxID=92897 RepID=A0AA39XTV0_9PEZI|nr:hypothetical protein B0T16DRAFT_497718 [Cercophora newfieldiana]